MSNNNGNSFFAFLSGAAIGTLIGVLYAPDKGSNTRDKLSYQLDQYREKLQAVIDDLIDGKQEISSMAREQGDKIKQETLNKAEQIMSEIDALQKSIHQKPAKEETE